METTVSMVLDAAAEVPDRPFLWFESKTVSYGEVRDRILALAAGLHAAGIGPGDRVAALLDDRPDVPALWCAVNLLAAIWIPLNTALIGAFLGHQLHDSDPAALIVDADYTDRVTPHLPALSSLRLLVCERAGSTPPVADLRVTDIGRLGATAWAGPPPTGPQPSDLSLILYTSGTTGLPKGCMLPHSYVCNVTRVSSPNRDPGDTVLSVLPFFHLNGLTNGFLNSAMRRSMLAIGGRFSVSRFWPIMAASGARHINLLGAMSALLARMPDVPEIRQCRGQLVVAGGAPYPPEIAEIWRERFGAKIIGSGAFGLTECAPVALTPRGIQGPYGTSGRRNDVYDVSLRDNNDQEVPDGKIGEICVRPKQPGVMFTGYWRQPEATLAAFANLWFHTGDLARFDQDGWLRFVDRKKDYLRRRGENISSQEVEHAVLTHPGVHQAAFHSVPSDLAEDDDLKLTVVTDAAHAVSEAQLYAWLAGQLPRYALPRYIEYRHELPLTASGRVQKQELRLAGVTPATWERPSER
jgi:crotonobetaine/carnitine-CoA ligase